MCRKTAGELGTALELREGAAGPEVETEVPPTEAPPEPAEEPKAD